jgi:putative ATPase
LYSHEFPENVSGQQYLEDPLDLYLPKSSGAEQAIGERLKRWKEIRTEISRKKDD